MGSIGEAIVDLNKVFFGSVDGSLDAVNSGNLGSFYETASDIYNDGSLKDILG